MIIKIENCCSIESLHNEIFKINNASTSFNSGEDGTTTFQSIEDITKGVSEQVNSAAAEKYAKEVDAKTKKPPTEGGFDSLIGV